MAVRIPYAKTVWIDRDNTNNTPGTKLNAQNFNKIEAGLEATDGVVAQLEATIAALELSNTTITNSYDALKLDFDKLKADFLAHVHENDAGTTTGPVVVPAPITP